MKEFSSEDIVNYLEGYFNFWLYQQGLLSKEKQAIITERKNIAFECLLNGECIHCGCKTPEKFFASDKCSHVNCYREVLNRPLLFKFLLKMFKIVKFHNWKITHWVYEKLG